MNRTAMSRLTPGVLLAFTLWGCSAKPHAQEQSKTATQLEQSKAVAEIEKLGGKVVLDENSPDKAVIDVDLSLTKVTDAGLASLEGVKLRLRSLDLGTTDITDGGLVYLKGLTTLRYLNLAGTKVTDAGLAHLTGLSKLESLNLTATQITDTGLVYLTALDKLQSLNVATTSVTNAGRQEVRKTLPACTIIP